MDYLVSSPATALTSGDSPQLSFETLVNTFLTNKDLRESSERSYRTSFAQFGIYLQTLAVSVVTEKEIKDFKTYLMGRKLSTFTVISHLSALKSLFSFLANRSLYPDVAKDIKLPKKPREFMRDALTKAQAQELLQGATGEPITAKRDYAILSTLLRCGLRSIEIVRADIGDVRRCNGTPVLWVHGKGRDGKDEYVVLTTEALRSIKAYLSMRTNAQEEEPLFASHGPRNNNGRLTTRSIRRMVKDHLKNIGLNEKELTCHSLRHTFATLALANNAPLIAVQKAMRHANINTTTVYTHMADRLTNGAEQYIDI
jgi:integrase/recombinase XerD